MRNFYISFGIWIILIPHLGIPGTWKNTLMLLSGLFLIMISLGPVILKKLQTKPKPKKRPSKTNIENQTKDTTELRFSNPPPSQTENKNEN